MAAEANFVVSGLHSIQQSVAGLACTHRKIKNVPEKNKALRTQLANAQRQGEKWGPKFTDCPPFNHLSTWIEATKDDWILLEEQADKAASSRLCFPCRVAGDTVKGGLEKQLKVVADHLSLDTQLSQARVSHHNVPWRSLQFLHMKAVQRIANHLLIQQQPAASIQATANPIGEAVNAAVACFGQLAELQNNNQQAGALLDLWPEAKCISDYYKDNKVCFVNAATLSHTDVPQAQCKQQCCLLKQLSGDQSTQATMGDAQTALQHALSQAGRSLIIVQSVSTAQMWACLQELKGAHQDFKLLVTVQGCNVGTDLT